MLMVLGHEVDGRAGHTIVVRIPIDAERYIIAVPLQRRRLPRVAGDASPCDHADYEIHEKEQLEERERHRSDQHWRVEIEDTLRLDLISASVPQPSVYAR